MHGSTRRKRSSRYLLEEISSSIHGRPKNKIRVQPTVDPKAICEFVIATGRFKHRQCCHYVKALGDNSSLCQCGRTVTWHEQNNIPVDTDGGSDTTWTPAEDSRPLPGGPTTFGFINFRGFGQKASKSAPYIRLDYTTPNRDVCQLLSEYWCLPQPKLIISVIGGAQKFVLKDKMRISFKSGLINAATTASAWIITGGTETGVMEFVGEAFNEHVLAEGVYGKNVVVLGITTWGIINNKRTLVGAQDKGRFPAIYGPSQCTASGAPLDHNHTHFLLVDDGTEGQFGREIEFRKDLEKYLSETCRLDGAASEKAWRKRPRSHSRTVLESVKRNLPVVVIQGSGRAADLIADAFHVKESQPKEAFDEFWKTFNQNLTAAFDWTPDTDETDSRIESCKRDITELLEYRHLIIVFALESCDARNGMEYAILKALLKANKSSVKTQLNLSLAWNRGDVAREEIFSKENRTRLQNVDLSEAMLTALMQNQPSFVQLFLDNGVDLKQFLTVRRLRDLYHNVLLGRTGDASGQLLRQLLQRAQSSWRFRVKDFRRCSIQDTLKPDPQLLEAVGKVVCSLLREMQKNLYKGPHFVVDEEVPTAHERNPGCFTTKDEIPEKESNEFDYPERELLVWAVLLNRKDLAFLFWKAGVEHLGAALTACAILKSLSETADKHEELHLSLDLTNNASEFEDLAVGVLHECSLQDRDMAHKLLVRELKTWGMTTLLDIADSSEEMTFMGHSACQQLLNKIWRGKMAVYTSTLKIFTTLVMPFMLLFIKFTGEKREAPKNKVKKPRSLLEHASLHWEETVQSSMLKVELDNEGVRRSEGGLFKVVPFGNPTRNSIGLLEAAYYYHTAPVVKFCYHTISQVIYICLFSYFVLCDLHPLSEPDAPSFAEFAVWIWTATLLVEELRQLWTKETMSLYYKLRGYLHSAWNLMDLTIHCMLATSILLRFLLSGDAFFWARQCYAVTLGLNYIRFMQVFYINKNIGPKVIMIREMLTDLMFFLCILVVFLLAFGVSAHALRYPNSDQNWGLLKDVVYMPYWQMYGQLFLAEIEGGEDCSNNRTEWEMNPDIERCPEPARLVTVLLALYLMLTNVLLLNLLIAMFSHTFQRVQTNSEKVWRFNRYGLIREYFDRPALTPPLVIFSHIWRLFKYIRRNFARGLKRSNDFKIVYALNDPEANQLSIFERAAMERYLFHQRTSLDDRISVQVTSANERIGEVMGELDAIRDRVGDQPRLFDSIWGSCKQFLNTSVRTLSGTVPVPPSDDQAADQQFTPSISNGGGAMENKLKRLEEKVTTKMSTQEKKLDEILQILQQLSTKRDTDTSTCQTDIE